MPSDNRYDLLRDSILETLGVPEDSALRAGPADKASAPADEPPGSGLHSPDSTHAAGDGIQCTCGAKPGDSHLYECAKVCNREVDTHAPNERASVFIADDGELLGVGLSNTLSERGSRYGDIETLMNLSQHIQIAMQTGKNWHHLRPAQREALQMIASKIARILNGDPDYRDNWHDIQGYARLAEERCREK